MYTKYLQTETHGGLTYSCYTAIDTVSTIPTFVQQGNPPFSLRSQIAALASHVAIISVPLCTGCFSTVRFRKPNASVFDKLNVD